jgi:hypothetical protein
LGGSPTHNDSKAVISVIKPGDALIATHKELESTTKTALMQTAAKAAADAAKKPPLEVSNTLQLRDLASAAAKLFGWDQGQKSGDTYNTLVVTRAQLQEIRALREQALREQTDVQGDEEQIWNRRDELERVTILLNAVLRADLAAA